MVNIAGSRLVLNLKSFAASANPDEDLSWDVPTSPGPSDGRSLHRTPVSLRFADIRSSISDEESVAGMGTFDLEMYAIERDCQQLGTRLH